ncbi:hypothetical protein Bca4012_058769 [Brassica carinata]|uniref:Uncharacterized protein n=1 Tax=Brassica carinata TaxID=52824 RepID=A0A8X8B6F8_BRACI|nr:hypothetical protein Bca52824_016486 [Brassica carinata]
MTTSAEKDDGDGPVTRDRCDNLQQRRGSLRQRRLWWLRFQSKAEMNKEDEAVPRRGSSWPWMTATTEQGRDEVVKLEAIRSRKLAPIYEFHPCVALREAVVERSHCVAREDTGVGDGVS